MEKHKIQKLADASQTLLNATSSIEFLNESHDSLNEIHAHIYLTEHTFNQAHRKFKSTRDVDVLMIPDQCWDEIEEILLNYYSALASEAYMELQTVKNKQVQQ